MSVDENKKPTDPTPPKPSNSDEKPPVVWNTPVPPPEALDFDSKQVLESKAVEKDKDQEPETGSTTDELQAIKYELPHVPAKNPGATRQIPRPGESIPEGEKRQRAHNSDFYRTHVMEQKKALHRLLAVPQTRELKSPQIVTKVTLLLRGMKETLMMTEQSVTVLGRSDLRSSGFKPDVDLTPYGARERGVSRAHVRLHISSGKLFVTDLYSANGTFMGGEKLDPEKPYELHNGDELVLGALSMRVEME